MVVARQVEKIYVFLKEICAFGVWVFCIKELMGMAWIGKGSMRAGA
jgi:hypothetical protein